MANEKGPSRGPLVLTNCSSQEYAAWSAMAEKMFPAWCPDVLELVILLVQARVAEIQWRLRAPGAVRWMPINGRGSILLRIDRAGRVQIDACASDPTPEMLDLARALVAMGATVAKGRLYRVAS